MLGQVDRVAVEDNISTSDGGGFNIEEGNPASMGTTLPSLPVSADFDLDTGLSRTINYQYDNLYRLTDANYFVGGFSTSNYDYTYDIWGNRTQETVTAGADTQTTDYLYNISNQLVGVQNQHHGGSE